MRGTDGFKDFNDPVSTISHFSPEEFFLPLKPSFLGTKYYNVQSTRRTMHVKDVFGDLPLIASNELRNNNKIKAKPE